MLQKLISDAISELDTQQRLAKTDELKISLTIAKTQLLTAFMSQQGKCFSTCLTNLPFPTFPAQISFDTTAHENLPRPQMG